MTESATREAICRLGASIFARGLTFGSSGNISVRLPDGWLMTPHQRLPRQVGPGAAHPARRPGAP